MKNLFLLIVAGSIVLLQSCANSETSAQTSNMPGLNASELISDTDKEAVYPGTIKLTTEEFKNKVFNYVESPNVWKFEGDLPCIVDFYADWCAPCRMTAPILEELAVEYHGKINIYKVDTQKEQELAMVFGIQSIPAFLFCPKDGDPLMSAGIAKTTEETKKMFRQQIEEHLLK